MKNLKKIIDELKKSSTISIQIDNSKWKNHSILEDYTKNELLLSTDFNNNIFEKAHEIAIEYYLKYEDDIYNKFIDKFMFLCSKNEDDEYNFWDYEYDFGAYIDDYEIDLPKKVDIEWLQKNVKLIGINFLNIEANEAYLELDFDVSWDEEHGLRALLHKGKIISFGEGGICW